MKLFGVQWGRTTGKLYQPPSMPPPFEKLPKCSDCKYSSDRGAGCGCDAPQNFRQLNQADREGQMLAGYPGSRGEHINLSREYMRSHPATPTSCGREGKWFEAKDSTYLP